MNLKCLFFHCYEEVQRHAVIYFENKESTRPCDFETTFLLKCKDCGKLKTKKVKGFFGDDDDGGDEPPNKPSLAPDDYYDLVNK